MDFINLSILLLLKRYNNYSNNLEILLGERELPAGTYVPKAPDYVKKYIKKEKIN